MTIFRYQDDEGRGPFKPGMTDRWLVDHESKPVGLVRRFGPRGLSCVINSFTRNHGKHTLGFGCESLGNLFKWFTFEERQALGSLGYHLVAIQADRVVAKNEEEILFARLRPLHERAVILTIE